MSLIDIAIIAVVAFFVWKGVKLGLIEAIGGIAGLFGGAFIAWHYYPQVAAVIQSWLFNSSSLAGVISFIVLFIAANRAIALVFWIVDKVFHIIAIIPFLESFNHLLGGLLGLAEGLIFIAIIVFFLGKVPLAGDLNQKVEQSRFGGFVSTASRIISPFLPE